MSGEEDLGRTEIMRQIQGRTTEELGLLIPVKEPRTDQSAHTTEVLVGEPISFIGVIYRNMGEELLRGAEMCERQLHHQSPPQHR